MILKNQTNNKSAVQNPFSSSLSISQDTRSPRETILKVAVNPYVFNKNEDENGKKREYFDEEKNGYVSDYRYLTYRFQNRNLSKREFRDLILEGNPFTSAMKKVAGKNGKMWRYSYHRKNENFLVTNVLAIDIDNTREIKTESGEKIKEQHNYLTIEQALVHDFIKSFGFLVYLTPSHTKDHNKLRVVFVTPEDITDPYIKKAATLLLMEKFPGSDPACKDPCRSFYGNNKDYSEMYGVENLKAVVYENYDNSLSFSFMKEAKILAHKLKQEEEYQAKQQKILDSEFKDVNLKGFGSANELEEFIHQLLAVLPQRVPGSNTYNDYLGIWFALASLFPQGTAISIWDRHCDNPAVREEAHNAIKRCKNSKYTLGTLIYWAKKYDSTVVDRIPDSLKKAYKTASYKLVKLDKEVRPEYGEELVEIKTRYLGDHPFQFIEKGLIFVHLPKGCGKSHTVTNHLRNLIAEGRKVLNITTRITLGRQLSGSLGIPYVDDKEDMSAHSARVGYSLCINSLRIEGKAQFNHHIFKGQIVLLDEVVKVVDTMLVENLDHKEEIVKNFRDLITFVLSTGGLVICMDADFNNRTYKLLTEIGPKDVKIQRIVDGYEGIRENARKIYRYDDHDPTRLIDEAEAHVIGGCNIVIVTDSKDNVNGTKVLEKEFEKLKKELGLEFVVIRVDSETTGDENHIAHRCTDPGKLDELCRMANVLIYSPTLAYGVSIDLKDHFDAIYAIGNGVIPPDQFVQACVRVRQNIPIFYWTVGRSTHVLAAGETSVDTLITNTRTKLAQAIGESKKEKRKLFNEYEDAVSTLVDLEINHNSITTNLFSEYAFGRIVDTNRAMKNYADFVENLFLEDSHELIKVKGIRTIEEDLEEIKNQLKDTPDDEMLLNQKKDLLKRLAEEKDYIKQKKAERKAIKASNEELEAEEMRNALKLTDEEYEILKRKESHTKDEIISMKAFQVRRQTGQEASVESVKAFKNLLTPLKLRYAVERAEAGEKVFTLIKDSKALNKLSDSEIPLIHSIKTSTQRVTAILRSGVREFKVGEVLGNKDPRLLDFHKRVFDGKKYFEVMLDYDIPSDIQPIPLLKMFLKRMGYETQGEGQKHGGERFYSIVDKSELSDDIIEFWHTRDLERVNHQINGTDPREFFSDLIHKVKYEDGKIKSVTVEDTNERFKNHFPNVDPSELLTENTSITDVAELVMDRFVREVIEEMNSTRVEQTEEPVKNPLSGLPLFQLK